MQYFRIKSAIFVVILVLVGLAAALDFSASAQTNTTGAIAGIVSDPTGASVPSASVKIASLATGAVRTTATSPSGEFNVPQLPPGRYAVSVGAAGFENSRQIVEIGPNAVASINVSLTVGKTSEVVEVTGGEVPLLHVDDAQISTTYTEEQILTLPNPGNDLTFVAQTAPGSVMNTQGGYGNFSSFGLPGTANTFTVNGGYYNDPFLNISNSGATNLLLGANDIDSETVTSNAYNASFGGLGGAQVSEVTRSGGNKFHGNASYWWNGRVMNANDFFNNQSGSPRPFDNVNQWAGAIGGPIRRDKTFFFVDYEGLDVVLPSRATVYAPDASYQALTLANLKKNGLASEIPTYNSIFNLYNTAPGYSTAAVSTTDAASSGYGTVKFNGTAGNYTHEWLLNSRIDHTISANDHLFGHATIDRGVQASFTSLLNPLFNAASAQPSYDGQLSEQHSFSPAISNQFLFSVIHYVAVFSNASQAASEKIVPFSLMFTDGDMAQDTDPYTGYPGPASAGGQNFEWPQGRNVTGYQFQDDLSWTRGKHTMSVGWTMRRDDITDFSPSEYTGSPLATVSNADFEQGYVDQWQENFPTRPTQPVALYAMGWYAQDQWKLMRNLTVTYGLRMEHNSNPVCRTNCFAHFSSDFASVNSSTSTAYNKLIAANLGQAVPSLQMIGWEPRLGFAYLPFGPDSKTTIRGFGIFADAFPGVIADDLLNNAPSNVPFTVNGPANKGPNTLLVPGATSTVAGVPASAQSIAAASDAGFSSGFSNGGSFTTISAAMPAGVTFSAPNMTSPASHIKNPTYEEWSLAIEHQLSKFDTVSIMYVGNHSYGEPELNNGINAYNKGAAATGFPELSTTSAPNANFSAVDQISSSSNGNFNGAVLSEQHRSRSLTLTLNYQWSHALDDISNGGFNGFSGNSVYPDNPFNLRSNYGNADYDTRQYVSGSYVYALPHYAGPKLLVDNWEFAGTVFHSTGLPFSVVDNGTASNLTNYGGPLFANQIAPINGNTHCGGNAAAAASPTPCAFVSSYTSASDFGQSRRNQMFGPHYTDTDLSVTKGFALPYWESGKLEVGAQFFNLFNHPNFGQPANNIASAQVGTITSAVSTPTSILGSFLGGDASPRLIQLMAKFNF